MNIKNHHRLEIMNLFMVTFAPKEESLIVATKQMENHSGAFEKGAGSCLT
jgi:hypothetical protein